MPSSRNSRVQTLQKKCVSSEGKDLSYPVATSGFASRRRSPLLHSRKKGTDRHLQRASMLPSPVSLVIVASLTEDSSLAFSFHITPRPLALVKARPVFAAAAGGPRSLSPVTVVAVLPFSSQPESLGPTAVSTSRSTLAFFPSILRAHSSL